MTWWCELWEIRWPEAIPQMAEGKAAHLARIETQLGLEELGHRMAQYLADDDDWLLQHKHPVGGFIARINSYEAAPASAVRPTARIRNCPQCHARRAGARRYLRPLRLDAGGVGSQEEGRTPPRPARRRSGSDGLRHLQGTKDATGSEWGVRHL